MGLELGQVLRMALLVVTFPKPVGVCVGGGQGGGVCWIESRQLFLPLEGCSLICIYSPCRKGILNCDLRIGTDLLPVFTRGSQVWPGLCLYRHWGCKNVRTVGMGYPV